MHGCTDDGRGAADVDLTRESVVRGVVTREQAPASGAYVRLLDAGGEFVAEVVTPASGDFRFFVAPGEWTLSVMHRVGRARATVRVEGPGAHDTTLALT